MAAIEMRAAAPIMQDMTSAGSKAPMGQGSSTLSFTDLLASLQGFLNLSAAVQPSIGSEGPSAIEDSQEVLEWSEEQLAEIQSLIGTLLQTISAMPPGQLSDPVKEEANQLIKQLNDISIGQDIKGSLGAGAGSEDPISVLTQALSLVEKVKASGIQLDSEADHQLRKLVQALPLSLEAQESDMQAKKVDIQQVQTQALQLPLSYAGLIHKASAQFQATADGGNPISEVKTEPSLPSGLPPFTSPVRLGSLPEQGNGTPTSVHQERFVSDMTDMLMSKIRITQQPGLSEAKVSLYPEHLGQLDVKISLQQGQLVAQFMADTAGGRELLEANLSALRSALQQQGIQVDKLDVYYTGDAGFMNQQQQRDRSGHFQQNQQGNPNRLADIHLEEEAELSNRPYDSSESSTKSIDFTA